jgi:hypothetical protein
VWRCGVVASGTKLETGVRADIGVMISAISRTVSATHALALWLRRPRSRLHAHHSYLSYEDTGIPVWLRIRDTRAHHTGKSEARKLGIGDWHSELGFRGDVQLIAISNHAAQIDPVPEWVIVLYLYVPRGMASCCSHTTPHQAPNSRLHQRRIPK